MNVPGCIAHGCDHGRTATLCPRQVSNFRRSWVDAERSGHSEEDHIVTLEAVKRIMKDGGMYGPERRNHLRSNQGGYSY